MMISNPAASQIRCEDCLLWMVDIKNMDFDRHPYGHPHFNQRIERPANSPTPCGSCPKCKSCRTESPSPQYGKQFDLSSKNQKTLELYFKVKSGAMSNVKFDDITLRNFALIEKVLTMSNQANTSYIAQTPKVSL